MSKYFGVVQQLLIDTIVSGGTRLSTDFRTGLSYRALSGFLLFVAAGFLTAACFLWLITIIPTYFAAGLISLIYFIAGGISLSMTRRRLIQRRTSIAANRTDVEQKIKMAMELMDGELGEIIADNPKSAIAVAGLAGVLLSTQIR